MPVGACALAGLLLVLSMSCLAQLLLHLCKLVEDLLGRSGFRLHLFLMQMPPIGPEACHV
jgi:hypothetical protein